MPPEHQAHPAAAEPDQAVSGRALTRLLRAEISDGNPDAFGANVEVLLSLALEEGAEPQLGPADLKALLRHLGRRYEERSGNLIFSRGVYQSFFPWIRATQGGDPEQPQRILPLLGQISSLLQNEALTVRSLRPLLLRLWGELCQGLPSDEDGRVHGRMLPWVLFESLLRGVLQVETFTTAQHVFTYGVLGSVEHLRACARDERRQVLLADFRFSVGDAFPHRPSVRSLLSGATALSPSDRALLAQAVEARSPLEVEPFSHLLRHHGFIVACGEEDLREPYFHLVDALFTHLLSGVLARGRDELASVLRVYLTLLRERYLPVMRRYCDAMREARPGAELIADLLYEPYLIRLGALEGSREPSLMSLIEDWMALQALMERTRRYAGEPFSLPDRLVEWERSWLESRREAMSPAVGEAGEPGRGVGPRGTRIGLASRTTADYPTFLRLPVLAAPTPGQVPEYESRPLVEAVVEAVVGASPAKDGQVASPANDGQVASPANDGQVASPANDGQVASPASGGVMASAGFAPVSADGGPASLASGGQAASPASGGVMASPDPFSEEAVTDPYGVPRLGAELFDSITQRLPVLNAALLEDGGSGTVLVPSEEGRAGALYRAATVILPATAPGVEEGLHQSATLIFPVQSVPVSRNEAICRRVDVLLEAQSDRSQRSSERLRVELQTMQDEDRIIAEQYLAQGVEREMARISGRLDAVSGMSNVTLDDFAGTQLSTVLRDFVVTGYLRRVFMAECVGLYGRFSSREPPDRVILDSLQLALFTVLNAHQEKLRLPPELDEGLRRLVSLPEAQPIPSRLPYHHPARIDVPADLAALVARAGSWRLVFDAEHLLAGQVSELDRYVSKVSSLELFADLENALGGAGFEPQTYLALCGELRGRLRHVVDRSRGLFERLEEAGAECAPLEGFLLSLIGYGQSVWNRSVFPALAFYAKMAFGAREGEVI